MAKENLRKIKEEGIDEDNEQQAFFMKQMEDLVNQVEQMGSNEDNKSADPTNTAFLNTTITSPYGSEVMNHNNDAENGNFNPPPEVVRQAIQNALTGVIDRLAQMSSPNNNGGGIPMNIARAFSQVLSNENLRRGIAENLSRAAPALIDPRCQGGKSPAILFFALYFSCQIIFTFDLCGCPVMLSVYVPPGPDHPNKGMMPGDQFKDQKQAQPQAHVSSSKDNSPHGVGGWLNKILSSSSDKGKGAEEEDQHHEDEASNTVIDTVSNSASETTDEKAASAESQETEKQHTREPESSKLNKPKGSKRKRSMDRARTLAVAAVALAGAKKEQREKTKQDPIKLTPQQRGHRNLVRLQALCRNLPLPSPVDPVRSRSWDAWSDREEGSVVFRKNRLALLSQLHRRKLSIELNSSRGAGTALRQMLSVRDVTAEMDNIIKCAVELEAERAAKSQRHEVMELFCVPSVVLFFL
jgi:hypothetical protein